MSDLKAGYIGTEPWKPKEALEEQGEITDKADIFAYGLTLWEMMTLTMPHLDMLEDEEEDEDEGETQCCQKMETTEHHTFLTLVCQQS